MHFPVWVNGTAGGTIDPADRGLAYGDGVFETLLLRSGRAVLRDGHLARLAAGAAALGIPLDAGVLARDFDAFVAACPSDCVAKIILTRGVGGRGYLPPDAVQPLRLFTAHPAPVLPAELFRDGIDAVVCALRLSRQPALAGIKHLNRLEQVLLRRETAAAGVAEGLVCDDRGRVIEGVASNVFLVSAGRLLTPRLDEAGVRGVLRAALLDQARREGHAVQEADVSLEDVAGAEEVFLCNSINGIWPVRSLAGRQWQPGPVTRHWQAFWQGLEG